VNEWVREVKRSLDNKILYSIGSRRLHTIKVMTSTLLIPYTKPIPFGAKVYLRGVVTCVFMHLSYRIINGKKTSSDVTESIIFLHINSRIISNIRLKATDFKMCYSERSRNLGASYILE